MYKKVHIFCYIVIAFVVFNYVYFVAASCNKELKGDFAYHSQLASQIASISKDQLGDQIERILSGYPYPGFGYLPVYYILLNKFNKLGALSASVFWILLNQIFFMAALFFLIKTIKSKLSLVEIAMMAFVIFNFEPVYHNMRAGQISFLMLILFAGCLYFLMKRMSIVAGILMGLAISIKFTPVIFLPFILWKRDYKFLCACIATISAVVVISVARCGLPVHYIEFSKFIPSEIARCCGDMVDHSLPGLFKRLFTTGAEGNSGIIHLPILANILTGVILCTIILMSIKRLRGLGRNISDTLIFEFAFLICIMLLISSWVAIYHLVWALIPLLAVLLNTDRIKKGRIWIFLASFILLASKYWPDGLAFCRQGWGLLLLSGRQVGMLFLWAGLFLILGDLNATDKRHKPNNI